MEEVVRGHCHGMATAQKHMAVSVWLYEACDWITMKCPTDTQGPIRTWGEAEESNGWGLMIIYTWIESREIVTCVVESCLCFRCSSLFKLSVSHFMILMLLDKKVLAVCPPQKQGLGHHNHLLCPLLVFICSDCRSASLQYTFSAIDGGVSPGFEDVLEG